jgi:8-oxo-dGTP diphosphatase
MSSVAEVEVPARQTGVIVILRDGMGRFLLGRRSVEETSSPGYWLPVAGTMEPGETQEATVVREALEESGFEVKPLVCVRSLDTDDGAYRLHYWIAEVIRGVLRPSPEHSELRWVGLPEALQLTPMHAETREVLAWVAARRD